jgi:hypothetical protein
MQEGEREVREVLIKAVRGLLTKREMAMIGYAKDTKAVITRTIEASPALEAAILNIAELAYRDGMLSEVPEMTVPVPDPESKPERCLVCYNVHNPEHMVKVGRPSEKMTLIPGHEYLIGTKTPSQKYPRLWRMGFLGAYGYELQFSARGPGRTHSGQTNATHNGQYGGTQTLAHNQIISAREVARDEAQRHVGKLVREGQ